MTKDTIQQFYKHFCTPTDGGMLVDFTSKTLKDKDGSISLDDWIDQSHLALIERIKEEVEKLGYERDITHDFYTKEQNDGYFKAIDDIKTLLNNI